MLICAIWAGSPIKRPQTMRLLTLFSRCQDWKASSRHSRAAHAVAYAMKLAKEMESGSILVNCSGRGDKDLDYVLEHYGDRLDEM